MTVDLHHELSGPADAPVLVLSHALGLDAGMWNPLKPSLGNRFRLLLVDTRGHGRSPAPSGPYRVDDLAADFLRLFDRLGLDRVSWCGLSLGGMIGMWLAAAAPERIDRLALCCTASRLPPARGWHERAATVRRTETTAGLVEQSLGRWLSTGFRRSRPEIAHQCVATLITSDVEGYAGCCEAIAGLDLRPLLPRIAAPTLVLSGMDDPICTVSMSAQLADSIPGADFLAIPGRHLAAVESAQRCGPVLAQHLGTSQREAA